jgi:hypothetical protein
MKFRMTPNQKLWANIFSCAQQRSDNYFLEKDLDRHAREHSTAMLALQKGEQFWKEFL